MNTEFAEFAKGHFDTTELPTKDGYTWTLASRIGNMLSEIEDLFGERDKSWTILGVEINSESSVPQNWYPGGSARKKNIVFQLVSPADKNIVNANYQLAHEVVHSLSPNIELPVNVLEEGLASWFARYYVHRHFGEVITEELASYRRARESVEKLLTMDKESIKKLRAVEPCFKKMTQATFDESGLMVVPKFKQTLLLPFER